MSKVATPLKVKRMYSDVKMPRYATDGSACFDIHAYRPKLQPLTLGPTYASEVISTGLIFEIPENHVLLIFSRSGHAFNSNVRLGNCVGVIDSDYTGEVKVKLTVDNPLMYSAELTIRDGDRIAQAMLVPIPNVSLIEVDDIKTTSRGTGGFGSTGK